MEPEGDVSEALDFGSGREALAQSAEDCVAACLEAGGHVDPHREAILRTLAGVASLTAERARSAQQEELVPALSLLARIVESRSLDLELLSGQPEGQWAAIAACRCAEECRRALALLYVA